MTDNTMAASVEDEGRSKRTLLLAGGLAGVLVLGGGGFLLLHGGGSSDEAFTPPVHHATVSKPVANAKPATVRKASSSVAKLPVASTVKIGRDPFAAQYIVPVAAPAGSTSSASTTSTSTDSSSSADSAPGTATGARYNIVLTKITTDPGGAKLFTFTVGTASNSVLPAQRFGKYGELVVLTYVKDKKGAAVGAVLQVGDDNPITVPVGVKTSVL